MVDLLRLLLLSLRTDGLGPTLRHAAARLFGKREFYLFVRYPNRPAQPVDFPVDINGVTIRSMNETDRRTLQVRRHEPRGARSISTAIVATRGTHIVGAAWYADSVTAKQPWYEAVERHLVPPALLTANIYVVPGDKGAAWALVKSATDGLATRGVRTIVGLIRTHNQPSILMARLFGAKIVARISIRHWFGRATTVVAPLSEDRDTCLTPPESSGPLHRRQGGVAA